jgi:hypothetical protein
MGAAGLRLSELGAAMSFRTTIRSAVARFPQFLVLICIGLLGYIAYGYLQASGKTEAPLHCHVDANTNQNMTLIITPSGSGKISLFGHGYLNNAQACQKSTCKVRLIYVDEGEFGTLGSKDGQHASAISSFESSEDIAIHFKEDDEHLFEVRKDDVPVESDITYFPFEEYRVSQIWPQFIAAGKRMPMQIGMRVGQPTVFQAHLAEVGGPYSDASEKRGVIPKAGCRFIMKRQGWYRAMVSLLLVLLCTPLVHTLYKEDAAYPGLQLITAIVGVAGIRAFLIGAPTEGIFYLIDFAFVVIVVFTGMVPLWRLHSK